MLSRLSKNLIGLVAIGVFAMSAWAQAPAAGAKQPQWKDQGEYDIVQSIQKESDPQKKLAVLNTWEQKYPTSDFKGLREVTKAQILSAIVVKGLGSGASAADQAAADKAAHDLIDNIDTYMAEANKPAQATAAQWTEAKQQILVQSHLLLGTLAMNKKTPEGDGVAEIEFKKVIELNPNVAQVSYQLGTLIIHEQKPEKFPEALYDIAHAIDVTGPMALAASFKPSAQTYLKKAYEGYHGSDDGLDDLLKAAVTSPTMPPGFTIESVVDIQKKQEGDAAAFAAAHPDLAFWRKIKEGLTNADTGATYFDALKDVQLPPENDPTVTFKMFTAKVISQPSPKEILVNVDGNPAGDATLTFDTALKGTIDPGTEIQFKGQVGAFNKDPYMLTFTGMDKDDVTGLPDTVFKGAPAARRRTTKKQ